jgi:hypothetical protein
VGTAADSARGRTSGSCPCRSPASRHHADDARGHAPGGEDLASEGRVREQKRGETVTRRTGKARVVLMSWPRDRSVMRRSSAPRPHAPGRHAVDTKSCPPQKPRAPTRPGGTLSRRVRLRSMTPRPHAPGRDKTVVDHDDQPLTRAPKMAAKPLADHDDLRAAHAPGRDTGKHRAKPPACRRGAAHVFEPGAWRRRSRDHRERRVSVRSRGPLACSKSPQRHGMRHDGHG